MRTQLCLVWHSFSLVWHSFSHVWHSFSFVWHSFSHIWHSVRLVWHSFSLVWHSFSFSGGASPCKTYKTAIHHLLLASLFEFLFMCFNSLFFLFSDIFESYFWNQDSRISDSTLCTSSEDLKKLIIGSEAENTLKKYSYA